MAKYGRFNRDGSAYIITRFDTPRPWINLIGNERYGLCLSQNGFGYSFFRNWIEVRLNYTDIIGYVPTHPQTGKFVFLRDQDSGRCWPNMPMHTARGYSGYRCTHGQGYSRLSARREGIQTDFLAFVPPGTDPVELWQVTLTNRSRRTRWIKVFPYQQWHLTAPTGITDVLTYTRASYRPDLGAIVARMTNPTAPLQYNAFMAADFQPEEHDCNYDRFVGVYSPLETPQAVLAGAATDSPASGERMVGVLTRTFELAPGAAVTFRILTGVSQTDAEVTALKARYLSEQGSAAAFAAVQDFSRGLRGKLRARTGEPTIDLMANHWAPWHSFLTTHLSRGGHHGFRDLLQDAMGYCPLAPAFTRAAILEALRHQYASGLCVRAWSLLENRMDPRRHRDSPCWIPLTLSAYLRETGDLAFLDAPAEYLDAGPASVFAHALAGLTRVYEDRAPNGLCLIGDGDWNDSLNEIARQGRGNSVWLTIAAVYGMNTLAEIADAVGRTAEAARLRAWAQELKTAVNARGWDGRWYVYAFDDNGAPVGSAQNAEGRIHLNVQTWAALAGVAEGERLKAVLKVIDEELDTPYGPVLMHPPYTGYVKGIGKVSGKNPGMAENGPIYTHAVMFKILADLVLGRGDKAFESYMKVCPASPLNTGQPERFTGEPFAPTRYLVGPGCPERFGAAPYSYNTGSAGWALHLLYERLLGVRPGFDCLVVDPCVPAAWEKFEVVRPFRGATYSVRVSNPAHVQRGVKRVRVDGQPLTDNRVPLFGDGKTHAVDVEMG